MNWHNEQKTGLDLIHENNARDKATAEIMDKIEVVVSGNCIVCGKHLNRGRLFVCKECESNNTYMIKR